MIDSIKYLFIGLIIGIFIVLLISLLARLFRRFSPLLKLSSFLSDSFSNMIPFYSAKLMPVWLSALVSLAAAFAGLQTVFSILTPYIFLTVGLVIGIFAGLNILEVIKELRNR